jgi:hypothetical protein
MNSFFISFKALCFHICLYLVQPRLHSFGFGFLPYERVWHPCLDGHLSKTRTWGTMDGSQTLHNVVHKLACLLILCHCFSSLDHKCAKGVHKNQKLLGQFLHFWSFFLSLLRSFVHNWTFYDLLVPLSSHQPI